MFVTVNERLKLELRPGPDGWGVHSIVPTNFGGNAVNQVFWSKHEGEARAFMQGVQMMNSMT
jgi:hypothetical protein